MMQNSLYPYEVLNKDSTTAKQTLASHFENLILPLTNKANLK